VRTDQLLNLPPDLPVPVDDGAADHLVGMALPAVVLPATDGTTVRLDDPGAPPTVVFAYPRTGRPDEDPPGGLEAWNAIPGARGCTPQACGYRDRFDEFVALGVRVFGLSTQDTAYQSEAATRLELPYPLLSDERLELATALDLPRWDHLGQVLLKRLTMLVRDGRIGWVEYPVFPSDADAGRVLDRLRATGSAPVA
jgi:peroxiredoxin